MKTKLSKLIDKKGCIKIKGYRKDESLRVRDVNYMIEAFDEVCISEKLKFGFFKIPFAKEIFNTDEELIQMVTGVMHNVKYHPATLGDLISYIRMNPLYASRDENVLDRLSNDKMIALGSVGQTNNLLCVPFFHVYMESFGSSIDRDLSYSYYPELRIMYFKQSKNPCHYHLMNAGTYNYTFLGVLDE